MLHLDDLPPPLRRYVLLVMLAGPAAAAVVGAADPSRLTGGVALRAAVLAALAIVAERYQFQLTHRTHINVTTAAFVAMILLLPTPLPGLLALLAVGVGHVLRRRDPLEALFNIGQGALYVTAGALCFEATRRLPLGPRMGDFGSVGSVVLTVAVLHLVNTALVEVAAALHLGVSPLRLWRRALVDDLPVHATLSALGVVAGYLADDHPLAVPVLALPVVLVHRALRETVRLRGDTRDALAALVEIVELRDPYTAGHSRRVAATARALALRLGSTPDEADLIESAGRVHDVGKVGIDPAVLTKPGKLNDAEWDEMRRHPVLGADVVGRFAAYGADHRLVRHHHEAWDGGGYPDGLAGEDIPLGARILAVADTFDALTSDRPYRPGMSVDRALQILREGAGRQWDREVAAALVAEVAERDPATVEPVRLAQSGAVAYPTP